MSQVPVDWLLQKAHDMFPEGTGRPRAFAKGDAAAAKTNELLENGMTAIEKLWIRLCAGQPCDRSRPFPCYGSGRERSWSRGAGACPATAHWREAYKGAQQPQDLELGAFSPHSHDMPASPALSLCLRQPRRTLKRARESRRRHPFGRPKP